MHMIQHFDEDTIFDIFESQQPGILEEFLTCLITVLRLVIFIRVFSLNKSFSKVYNLPHHDFGLVYGFILECLKLLIVLLSSQMFQSDPKTETRFSCLINKLGFPINSRLVKSLVSLIHANVPDPRLLPVAHDSGLVFGMIQSIWKSVQDENIPDEFLYSVARNAEILLLALGQQPYRTIKDTDSISADDKLENGEERDEEDPKNDVVPKDDVVPIRVMLSQAEPVEIDSNAKFKISFNKLYHALIHSQHRESGTLLLYTLLHENVSFRTYILR